MQRVGTLAHTRRRTTRGEETEEVHHLYICVFVNSSNFFDIHEMTLGYM